LLANLIVIRIAVLAVLEGTILDVLGATRAFSFSALSVINAQRDISGMQMYKCVIVVIRHAKSAMKLQPIALYAL